MTTNTVYHVACVGKEVAVDLRSKPQKKKKKLLKGNQNEAEKGLQGQR